MIAGPSQCGKTTFTKLLLQYADVLFERPIRKIVYCYGQWQECFQDMASQITFVEGIPEDIPALFPMGCRPGILVLDDLMRNCSEDERILDLFTKVSHHCDVTCIYLTQNLFPPGKFSRSISLNAHYIIAFNNIYIMIHWVSEPWLNKLLQGTFLTYGKVFKMPPRSRMVISCWVYIREHRLSFDYVATYCLSHNLCLWSTSTRNPIKQTDL